MELTKREKELLILYKAFYGKDFDPLDLASIEDFQSMYCILQTLPSSVGTKVIKLNDFKMESNGVFSGSLDTELTKLSQVPYEVKEFNQNISVDYFVPITVACTNPDIDLSSDQGIISAKDYALFAKACLFVSDRTKTRKELEDFLEQETSLNRDIVHGERNIRLTDYIVLLLRGYGLVSDYPYIIEEQGKFREGMPTLNAKEKEALRNFYLFYGKYYDHKSVSHKDNLVNAYCILEHFPKEAGVDIENHYEFLQSRIMDRVESPELDTVLEGLDLKTKEVREYYNEATPEIVSIGKILLESGFTTVDALGRVAKTCIFVDNHPCISGEEVLDYLNKLDRDDGYLNNNDDNLNKKIVNIMERYGLIKRYMGKNSKCDTCEYHKGKKEEQVGFVKKLARIWGGQK